MLSIFLGLRRFFHQLVLLLLSHRFPLGLKTQVNGGADIGPVGGQRGARGPDVLDDVLVVISSSMTLLRPLMQPCVDAAWKLS